VTARAGLGNRLKVLLSGIALAEASQRAFTMMWPRTHGCNCSFDRLFQNGWNVTEDALADEERLIELSFCPWLRFPDLLSRTEQEIVVHHNSWLIQPQRFATHATLAKRCEELMGELAPVPFVEKQVAAFQATSFRPTMIGVHLRRGDMVTARPHRVGNLRAALQVVDRWLEQEPEAGILLCTDDGANDHRGLQEIRREGIRDEFGKRYGSRVVSTQPRSLDRNQPEAIEDALVDLWLLRKTDLFVGTAGSTFSEMAVYGRTVPAVMTAEPTPRYQQHERWLKRTGVRYLLRPFIWAEFGHDAPCFMLWRRYRRRLRSAVRALASGLWLRPGRKRV